MATKTRSISRGTIVALAPAALLLSFVIHDFLPGRLPNDAAVAEAVAAGTTRWGLVHMATAVSSGLLIIAFLAIRSYLREAGEDRFSAVGVPFIVMGGTLFTMLPAMELTPMAVAETGAATPTIAAVQAALSPWFVTVLVVGALSFAVGVWGFARGIADSRVLSPGLTTLVIGALTVLAASRLVPLAAVQFYVQGAAGVLALWPLAYAILRHPQVGMATSARPIPAS